MISSSVTSKLKLRGNSTVPSSVYLSCHWRWVIHMEKRDFKVIPILWTEIGIQLWEFFLPRSTPEVPAASFLLKLPLEKKLISSFRERATRSGAFQNRSADWEWDHPPHECRLANSYHPFSAESYHEHLDRLCRYRTAKQIVPST